jgi:hypothetical protein
MEKKFFLENTNLPYLFVYCIHFKNSAKSFQFTLSVSGLVAFYFCCGNDLPASSGALFATL